MYNKIILIQDFKIIFREKYKSNINDKEEELNKIM